MPVLQESKPTAWRVTTTPPPPYPKEGYLPSPRPPPDIERGLNRSLSGRSDTKVSLTHQRVKGESAYATKLRLFMRASPAILIRFDVPYSPMIFLSKSFGL